MLLQPKTMLHVHPSRPRSRRGYEYDEWGQTDVTQLPEQIEQLTAVAAAAAASYRLSFLRSAVSTRCGSACITTKRCKTPVLS